MKTGTAASYLVDARPLLKALKLMKRGDFSVRLPLDQVGISGELAEAFNDVVELDEGLIRELERIANVVGREGKITQRASMGDVMGAWAQGINAINALVGDLVRPTSEVARVIGAVARGDLSQTMALEIDGGPLKGEFLRMARTINTMVNQLSSFTSEVTRVAREVGSEGKLGVQAEVKGVSGTWKDLTDSVNSMANNLTAQVRNIAEVTTAVAKGDLGKKITVDVKGEILELKNTINTMVDQLSSFASEVTRVAKEVGTDGKLGGQAQVKGVSGTWKDLTDNVNSMASNLTAQVRNIANVTTAVAMGDLSKKITVDVKGEVLELKNTINTMVDQLSSFASEVTRVAREVGTDGKLGGQARVKGVAGTWKDLTDSVNYMASNLTAQVRNIADVTTAVAKGDLSRKITVDVKGEISELKNTINVMVDQLRSFADEVTRVAREVGTEGKLGGQADVQGVSGTWKDLTDSVNYMASNLTAQVRNIADVTTAVAKGDLSKKITVDVKGEILELKDTINTMVDQLSSFAAEVTRVAREVGSEGKLGGQADVKGVSGTWRDLTDSVNYMAGNLTSQVRNIAEVTTAVANGDLGKKITVNVKGEILELKNTINTMVDQLSSFASEVTRVAREVGTEGKLGGQADVKGVSGTWKDLTDNVNSMAGNLTGQVRNIAEVTTAVANGNLSRKITVDVKGEILELKNTINTMVDQLSSFAAEVTRVAREVGSEGKLGGQADVKGVSGTWKDLTDSVNYMAGNLTAQVRNIAEVTTAVAKGDLSKKITVDVKGEILELKNTINVMVDQLSSFAAEVTRVAREVGSEGKLGGQADVKGVSGTWRDLTDSVNYMAGNLTSQVRNIAEVTTAVANGDLSKKITVDVRGEILELKNTINTMVDQLRSFADEVTRVAREVGTEGKLGGQAQVKGVSGTWKDLTDNVNYMASNLTSQVRNIADVTTAVAKGDLSRKITVDVKGEILELKNTINVMVDQLSSFASEVTRVAREVGTEGKLGGQAEVKGVSGTWKDLTDNVNFMAGNLTNQVRGIAGVVTAVAQGNLKRKLVLEAKGEIAALADTINEMIDTLATFAEQVTTVAREVGVEGELGGQARVPGAAGTWKDLTDNVNQLAANLTTQIRAIAEVATAITKGDLTRSIAVEAQGEVAALKDLINEMIRNLKDTTGKNTEQDWLKTNLAKFTRMLQGQRDLLTVANLILSELAPLVNAQHGVFYVNEQDENNEQILRLIGSYAYQARKRLSDRYKPGQGLVGQCAIEKHRILLEDVPDDYVKIGSGLGDASPRNIVVLPVLFEGDVRAVLELACLGEFNDVHLAFLDQLTESIGIVINTIEANMRTENLLKQSQSLAKELQSQQQELTETNRRLEQQAKTLQASENLLTQQQEELQQTNQELQEKARLLAVQNSEVERKNREIEQARMSLEDKAEQLALTSKYKSEFLANMSHELRTPLNSLLILSKLLADNSEGNLTRKQVEFSQTVHSAGAELLALINDILDLSKIESGTMSVDLSEILLVDLKEDMERAFRPIAEEKRIDFAVNIKETAGKVIFTDPKRLQQILKNLLSNAFKFTDEGGIMVDIYEAKEGWTWSGLDNVGKVVAFSVSDSGIGIASDKQKIIFEAFQQADGTTSRKYGGTGLGLAISREISTLLGGEIRVESDLGKGSRFTFYVPQKYVTPTVRRSHKMLQTMELYGAQPERDYSPELVSTFIEDDRDSITQKDKVLLILEDDKHFAKLLLEFARDHGFKCLVSGSGEVGVVLARRYSPDAVTLDLHLSDGDGWRVLDQLKRDPITRHIPVQVISVDTLHGRHLKSGAIGYLEKPVTKEAIEEALESIKTLIERPARRVLIVQHDDNQCRIILELIGNGDMEATAVTSGESALQALKEGQYDCMVVDLGLPDMSGFELAQKVQAEEQLNDLPIVVYAGDNFDNGDNESMGANRAVVVQNAESEERLLDKTAVFLNRIETDPNRGTSRHSDDDDSMLIDRKVLVVDDDVRNIFAVTSVLERHNVSVVYAENGGDGIQALKDNPDVDCILMDVMMPELDGYETMRQIRRMEKYRSLPIIALTARAMKGDREKCLEAGASDYIAKPVDTDELISLIRLWFSKYRRRS